MVTDKQKNRVIGKLLEEEGRVTRGEGNEGKRDGGDTRRGGERIREKKRGDGRGMVEARGWKGK